MSLWDSRGFGETHGPDGSFVVRYERGKVVEWLGPFDSERKTENAHMRWRQGRLNAADRKLLGTGEIPWSDLEEDDDA